MHKRTPKWLRLKRTQAWRIEKLLNRVPLTEPQISIRPYDGEPFEVEVLGAPDYFVPLHIGVEELRAEYDSVTGALLEANHLRVGRRVRVSAAWCLEVYETGGSLIDGHIPIIWYGPGCHRIGRDVTRSFDTDNAEEVGRLPRRLGPSVDVHWIDDLTAEGPDLGVVGFSLVEVGGGQFDCIRVLRADRFERGSWLDDIYFDREGRLVLLRRYPSREYIQQCEKCLGDDGEALVAAEADRLTINGVEYLRWYDMLTGLSLF